MLMKKLEKKDLDLKIQKLKQAKQSTKEGIQRKEQDRETSELRLKIQKERERDQLRVAGKQQAKKSHILSSLIRENLSSRQNTGSQQKKTLSKYLNP